MPRTAKLVQLSDDELGSLTTILTHGETAARVATRARVLDLLHRGKHPNEIADALAVCLPTVFAVKRKYLSNGFDAALFDQPRGGRPNVISGEQRARITALACSKPPAGHARWSLRLLADKAVELELIEAVSHNAVGEILKKTNSSRIFKSSGASAP